MLEKDKIALRDASPYNAAITREQFLFYEVRTTAKLVCEGLNKEEVVDRIVKENLFQYQMNTQSKDKSHKAEMAQYFWSLMTCKTFTL